MNSQNSNINTQGSFKMLRAMVGIGFMCALFIALTFEGTLPRIEKNKAEALEKAIFRVLPGITKTKSFRIDPNNQISSIDNGNIEGQVIYAGFDEANTLKGIAIEASGQGYADIIRILYGYSPENERIIGFNVLESKETPGLGDKIEKEDRFLQNFEALDVALNSDKSGVENKVIAVKQGTKKHPWEIDGITGATISSRAIGNIIDESANRYMPIIKNSIEALK